MNWAYLGAIMAGSAIGTGIGRVIVDLWIRRRARREIARMTEKVQ